MLYRVMSLMVSNRYLNLGNNLCVNGSTRENASLKILILSCNTGSGHNSAAAAIAEYAKTQGVTCDIMDALAFTSEHFSKMISNRAFLCLSQYASGFRVGISGGRERRFAFHRFLQTFRFHRRKTTVSLYQSETIWCGRQCPCFRLTHALLCQA